MSTHRPLVGTRSFNTGYLEEDFFHFLGYYAKALRHIAILIMRILVAMQEANDPPSKMTGRRPYRVSLKDLAAHLNLSPSTISFVLNDTPGRSIPETTRERVRAAAIEFNYRPNMIARSLLGKPMRSIGILLPVLGEGYHSQVLSGIGDLLMEEGYFYFTVHHRHKLDLIKEYPALLQARGVEGILAIDTKLIDPLPLPTVLIAGHTTLPDITNVVLDHHMAARLALQHLYDLGHRKIVFMKGQSVSTDTELRWSATMEMASDLGLAMDSRLTIQLAKDSTSPEISYPGIHDLLETRQKFTAILCFNDIAAMGSIRALHDSGLHVPGDVSIVGFDDIQSAAYQVPSLTTIRQPLKLMGNAAAAALLRRLAHEPLPPLIQVAPELIIRESTAPLRPNRVKKLAS
jgi:DNA-binding LacI/PurR family transcriptional regulator